MELTVLLGDDDLAIRTRRSALLEGADGNVERVDVAAEGGRALLDSVSAPSLFGGKRWISAENVEALDEQSAEGLVRAGELSDAVVVARAGGAVPPKIRDLLKKAGTVTTLTTPKGKGVGMRVDEMLRTHGVTLGGAERQLVLERAGHDLDRLDSVLRQLVTAGLQRPSRQQLVLLLGSTSAPGVPWDLTDALEEGKVAQALEAAQGLEAVPTVAYLASRNMQAGRLVDAGVSTAQEAQDLLGLQHRFQAEKLLRLARRLGPQGTRRAWDLLVAADRDVKLSRDPGHQLSLLIVKLGEVYQGR